MNPAQAAGPAPQPLRPVALPELRLQADGRHWDVDQSIHGLESLTPVRGELRAIHHGMVLEVEGQIATIVTLRCDRCLGSFNHPLAAEAKEILELNRELPGELAIAPPANPLGRMSPSFNGPLLPNGEDLDDRLDPLGHFDPERWIFEQLSLRLPQVTRCGADCPGPATWSSESVIPDPRWAALQGLQGS